MQYVHEGVPPPSCDCCGKVFYRREDLYRHMETHVADRNYSCNQCCKFKFSESKFFVLNLNLFLAKKFATKHAVKIHMRTHKAEDVHVFLLFRKFIIKYQFLIFSLRSVQNADDLS